MISNLPQPAYKDFINYPDAMNPDIITQLERNFLPARDEVKEFAKTFRGNNLTDTCYNVWKFAKQNLKYKADRDRQRIKYPGRAIADSAEGIPTDCKTFSLFCASILSWYAPVAFCYAAYPKKHNKFSTTPTHVYVLVKGPHGNIIVDGVWHTFNSEAFTKHKKIHWMTVETLTGPSTVFEDEEIQTINDLISGLSDHMKKNHCSAAQKNAIHKRIKMLHNAKIHNDRSVLNGIGNKANREARREKRKEQGGSKAGKVLKKVARGQKKIALQVPRLSFLSLVGLNFRGLASRIMRGDKKKITEIWEKLGGSSKKLLSVAASGAKKKPLFGESKKMKAQKKVAGIGVAPAVPALLIAAGSIMAAIAKALPKSAPGEDAPGEEQGSFVENLLKDVTAAGGKTDIDPLDPDVEITDKGTGADHSFFSSIPKPVLYGGGAALLFFGAKQMKLI